MIVLLVLICTLMYFLGFYLFFISRGAGSVSSGNAAAISSMEPCQSHMLLRPHVSASLSSGS